MNVSRFKTSENSPNTCKNTISPNFDLLHFMGFVLWAFMELLFLVVVQNPKNLYFRSAYWIGGVLDKQIGLGGGRGELKILDLNIFSPPLVKCIFAKEKQLYTLVPHEVGEIEKLWTRILIVGTRTRKFRVLENSRYGPTDADFLKRQKEFLPNFTMFT